jgi:hypothetical protein
MLKLIITADYEIFGDGSGCVRRCLIDPSEILMRVCEAAGARVTFFVDVCEYWAFRDQERKGTLPEGYTPASWIEKQLKDAVTRGHDVQLHMHPQWIDYTFDLRGKFEVNLAYWRLPLVPGGYGSVEDRTSLLGLFVQGRQTLEELLCSVKADYQCRAFRAGDWCIQPEKEVLKAIAEAGIWYDTSVAPGLKLDDGLTYFDFSDAPQDLPYWQITEYINKIEQKGKVLEIPIYTQWVKSSRLFYWEILKRMKRIPNFPPGCYRSVLTNSPNNKKYANIINMLQRKLSRQFIMLDYCNATCQQLKYMIKMARKRFHPAIGSKTIPIVAIGHPKNFVNVIELTKFLRWAKKQPYITLDTSEEISLWQIDPAIRAQKCNPDSLSKLS